MDDGMDGHTMSMSSVVYLPGTSGRGSFWDPVREQVEADDHVALDWPGLGGTPADPQIRSMDDIVRFTVDSMPGPSVLVAQSMGGYVAARIAIERPDLVTHLVLATTSAGLDRTALGLPRWTPQLQPGDDPGSTWVAAHHPTLDAGLRAIDVPVLLVWATNDEISPLAIGERLHELIATSSLITFDSDDHWVAREHADDVAAAINRLLTT